VIPPPGPPPLVPAARGAELNSSLVSYTPPRGTQRRSWPAVGKLDQWWEVLRWWVEMRASLDNLLICVLMTRRLKLGLGLVGIHG